MITFRISLLETRSSPYKQLLFGIFESDTHCPCKHDLALPHGVPSIAPIPFEKQLKLLIEGLH
jgi:hypothetical protein